MRELYTQVMGRRYIMVFCVLVLTAEFGLLFKDIIFL